MREIEEDRRGKGHFAAPCAGSIFKNDRQFGEPSGKIIDRVGLRGLRHGGAQVSSGHGNIIINTGTASARDIRDLVTEVQDQVYRETGHLLDPEVLFLGDWT
jgi:UDP-N-acetylmuramate dehydrogenase